jgi:primosomal protein DnaI
MINYNFKKDNNAALEFVREIQAKLPQYNVTISNVNDFELMLRERENCRQCRSLNNCQNDNKGYCTTYQNDEFVLTECKYKRDYRMQNDKDSLIKTLYLPKRVLNADIESFDTNCESRRKVFEYIIKFVSDIKEGKEVKGLYLYGPFSKGKTYTLACIANELRKNNINSLLIYFPDLVVDLKNAMGTARFEELVNMLKSIDVLMLDDVGSEKMTDWLRDEIIGPIINYRLMEGKPLFMSSNLTPTQYKEHLMLSDKIKAERIMSRLTSLVRQVSLEDSNTYKR